MTTRCDYTEFEESESKAAEADILANMLESAAFAAMRQVINAQYPDITAADTMEIMNKDNYFYDVADEIVELQR